MMGSTSIGSELVLIGRFSVEISPSAEILSRKDVLRGGFVDGDWLEVRASQQMQVAKIECCADQQIEAFVLRDSPKIPVVKFIETSDILPILTGQRHQRATHPEGRVTMKRVT